MSDAEPTADELEQQQPVDPGEEEPVRQPPFAELGSEADEADLLDQNRAVPYDPEEA
jgi:hypothetical protein